MIQHFRWIREATPGASWRALFARAWPSYRDWFLLEGDDARPSLATCRAKLHEHMPEMIPLWERLTRLSGGGDEAARMLSLYRPAPYLAGCTQAVWGRDDPVLVRNYDFHPAKCEGVFLLSSWRGARVLASSDCLWGALDGMNEYGLVASLSFGGSREVGDGFGIPLILRYVLECCQSVAEASAVLRRVPSHMAYNVSLLDAAGEYGVAYLAPDQDTIFERHAITTNHQPAVEWTEYARLTHSSERECFLQERLGAEGLTEEALKRLFLEPPLHCTRYKRGIGTLYTVAYHPRGLRAEYLWPQHRTQCTFDEFPEDALVVDHRG